VRGLSADETVEILEARARGPVLERAGRRGLYSRSVMPFAPGARGVAVILQDVSHQRTAPGNEAGIAVPIIRQFGDLPCTDPMMIAAGQQRRPGGRTHRRGVEPVVRDPFPDDTVHRRSLDFTTERGRQGGARVVDQHDENVRRVDGQPPRLNPLLVDRLLHRAPSDAGRCVGGNGRESRLSGFSLGSDISFFSRSSAAVTTKVLGLHLLPVFW
jgi:hypothetical protein